MASNLNVIVAVWALSWISALLVAGLVRGEVSPVIEATVAVGVWVVSVVILSKYVVKIWWRWLLMNQSYERKTGAVAFFIGICTCIVCMILPQYLAYVTGFFGAIIAMSLSLYNMHVRYTENVVADIWEKSRLVVYYLAGGLLVYAAW